MKKTALFLLIFLLNLSLLSALAANVSAGFWEEGDTIESFEEPDTTPPDTCTGDCATVVFDLSIKEEPTPEPTPDPKPKPNNGGGSSGGGGGGGTRITPVTTVIDNTVKASSTVLTPEEIKKEAEQASVEEIEKAKEAMREKEYASYSNLFGLKSDLADSISSHESKAISGRKEKVTFTGVNKTVYEKISTANPSMTWEMRLSVAYFIEFGTPTTKILGAGERAGTINSYQAAFGRIPSSTAEWQDVIKVANGRWTAERSLKAEEKAKVKFKQVYLRVPNMAQPNDNAAVNIMAYGLRPAKRNLESEKAAIKTFKHIFKKGPATAEEWDIARAIAYSGAVR